MINNRQNFEKYIILRTVILHLVGVAIQVGILEEDLRHPRPPGAPVEHWQYDVLEGPGVLTASHLKGFQFVACTITPKEDCYSVLKHLETWH